MPILAGIRPTHIDALSFTLAVTAWQLVSALPLLAVEQAQRRQSKAKLELSLSKKTMALALLTGAMFGLSTLMYVVAAEKIGAVNFIVLLQAYPLIALVLEAILLRSRKTRREWAFTVLIVAAIVYLMTEGTFRLSNISWWSGFALIVPVIWSLAHILLRQILLTTPISPNDVTVSRLVISGAFLLLAQFSIGVPGALNNFMNWDFLKMAMPLGVAYYIELLFWFYAMRHIDVSLGSSIMVPSPAITMLVTVFLLGGTVATWQVAAMVVVVIGLWGLLLSSKRN